MPTSATIGHGTLFKVGDGASPEVFTALLEQVEVPGFEVTMEMVDGTHMGSNSAFREFISGMGDAGEITVVGNFIEDGDDLPAQFTAMTGRTKKNYQIVFPGGAIFQCAGLVQGLSVQPPMDEKMTVNFNFKFTGVPTFTKAA
jgi:predicted secreted protein